MLFQSKPIPKTLPSCFLSRIVFQAGQKSNGVNKFITFSTFQKLPPTLNNLTFRSKVRLPRFYSCFFRRFSKNRKTTLRYPD